MGLDASGRPVLAELRRDDFDEPEPAEAPEALEVWFHGEGWSDVLTRYGARRTQFDEGRAAAVVELEGVLTIERWTWKAGMPVRGDIANVALGWRSAEAYLATADDQGRLMMLTRGYRQAELREDEEAALQASLAEAAALEVDQVVYDARIHRHEPHLRPTEQLAELLPAALEDAAVAGVAASRVERPFVVELFPGPDDDEFQPFARVGGERFRERMVALSPTPEAAVDVLYDAEPPDGATIELVDHLDQDAAQACREITTALAPYSESDEHDRSRASAVLGELGRELVVRLNRRAWPDASSPFLVLVHIGEQYDQIDPYALAAEAVGGERVTAFRASLHPARKAAAPPAEACIDRAALEALLGERGLTADAQRLAHQLAELGLRLHATGRARCRLGGPALLPPGEPWPHDAENRPLTFLAAIDLTELPERGPLPEGGWLLFFADLDEDGAEGLIDEAVNEPGAKARVFAVPAGAEPVPATQPAALGCVLNHRPVACEARLTLPDGYDAAAQLGLDPAEGAAYDAVAS
ncbi:MAG: YwqG family protein [Solirubrobacteraceae bacterium]